MTNTNLAVLNQVEERMNANIVKFPVHFTKSRELFEKVDYFNAKIKALTELAKETEARANEVLEAEYLDNEYYRVAHEFLADLYEGDTIGTAVKERLSYKNSIAICDPEGRWFRTVTDMLTYHEVSPMTYYQRKRTGRTLEECLSKERLPRRGGDKVMSK